MSGKVIFVPLVLILTSFFYFPFYFTFFPQANTKMILAACGLVLLFLNLGKYRNGKINKDFFWITLLACGVSAASFLTMTLNNTIDGAYLSYVVSMWVWTGAAYFVVNVMKAVHGKVTVELVCFYMIAVGVCQCIIAVMINTYAPIKSFVDSFLAGEGFMGQFEGRLYGIGCALDVAGGRFAVLLVMIAALLPRMAGRSNQNLYMGLLMLAFCIIAVIGNIIGRTTTVGLLMALAYMAFVLLSDKVIQRKDKKALEKWLFPSIVGAVLLFGSRYAASDQWAKHLRFGFEGFFSLFEKGRWEVHSNEMLAQGLVFPDNAKTWIIGDGYMGSMHLDPNYQGELWYGFYMGTDAGYSRFLFYFGIIGLGAFIAFMVKVCMTCVKRFSHYRYMFIMMLLLNLCIWIKVSTDIFLAFAPFLCFGFEENECEVAVADKSAG